MKYPSFLSALFAALLGLSAPVFGKYMRVETKEVPIKRLIENLTEKAKTDPKNAGILPLLARTHAVAYSKKLADDDTVPTWTGWNKDRPEQPWFDYDPPEVPFRIVTDTKDADKLAAAKHHLQTAIETYKKALALQPDDMIINLGLAWCQDQAGEKDSAIAGYRKVAAAAWDHREIFAETAGYLIPLLDPKKDAKEIAELSSKREKVLALPRMVTPIVVPLDGANTGIESLVDSDTRVRFDLDGTGRQLHWPWIQKNAAWLVFDPQNTGKITSAIQMFGSRTFLLFCQNGYQALSLLDDNADGIIDGEELKGLALWQDQNCDGISDPGEVKPVSAYGIKKLSTNHATHPSGMPYSAEGVTFENGDTRPTYDVILESK